MRKAHLPTASLLVGCLLSNSCDESISDCKNGPHPEWCRDFNLKPITEAVDRSAPKPLTVEVSDASSLPSGDIGFRVSVEQGTVSDGSVPSGASSPFTISLNDVLKPADLQKLSCAVAEDSDDVKPVLYLHANQLIGQGTAINPDNVPKMALEQTRSLGYLQHARTTFPLIDKGTSRFVPFTTASGQFATVSNINKQPVSKLALAHTNPPMLLATLDKVSGGNFTTLGATSTNFVTQWSISSFQLVGNATPTPLIVKGVGGTGSCGTSPVLGVCMPLGNSADANNCTNLSEPLSWCFPTNAADAVPSTDAATDTKGAIYFAVADSTNQLHVYNLPMGSPPAPAQVTSVTCNNCRHVAFGDLDNDGNPDLLALRSGADPLVWLRRGQDFVAAEAAIGMNLSTQAPLLKQANAVVAFGRLNRCGRGTDLLVGAGSLLQMVYAADGRPLLTSKNVLSTPLSLPSITNGNVTALMLADFTNDGRDDLGVAVMPSGAGMQHTIYLYQAN